MWKVLPLASHEAVGRRSNEDKTMAIVSSCTQSCGSLVDSPHNLHLPYFRMVADSTSEVIPVQIVQETVEKHPDKYADLLLRIQSDLNALKQRLADSHLAPGCVSEGYAVRKPLLGYRLASPLFSGASVNHSCDECLPALHDKDRNKELTDIAEKFSKCSWRRLGSHRRPSTSYFLRHISSISFSLQEQTTREHS